MRDKTLKIGFYLTITTKLNNVQPIIENIWAMAKKKVARKKFEQIYPLKKCGENRKSQPGRLLKSFPK